MKQNIKIYFLLALLGMGAFALSLINPTLASSSCTATMHFNPQYVGGTVTLSGDVTLSNLNQGGVNDTWFCEPSFGSNGYPGIDIGFNKGGNIDNGITTSVYIDLSNSGGSSKTFQFSKNIDISATGATQGQTVTLQACVFPTSSQSGDQTALTCSALTPLVLGDSSTPAVASTITVNVAGAHTIDGKPYQSGETFGLTFDLSSLYNASGSVKITTTVSGNTVGSFTQQRNALQSIQTQNNIVVTAGNGFSTGSNFVTVSVTDASSGALLGTGQASVNVDLSNAAASAITPPATPTVTCTGTGQGTCPNSNQTCTNGTCQTANAATPAVNNNSATTLYNPLPENDLVHVFLLITKGLLDIMGVLAVMFIIVGGFQLVIASGNEEAILKAKKTITWAVLGLAVALLSFSIVAIVEDLLQANITPAPTSSSPTSNIPQSTTNT